MKTPIVFLAGIVILALLFGCGGQARSSLRGGVLEPPQVAPDFTLTDHEGEEFTLSSQRGRLTLVYFGYTSCPDICPLTLATVAGALRELGASAEDVSVVFVTLDPERDTQQVLKRYVNAFSPAFTGVRGTPDEIAAVVKAYGVKVKRTELPNSALGYAIDHSGYIYVIDQNGQLRELLPFGVEMEDILNDVRILLNEGA